MSTLPSSSLTSQDLKSADSIYKIFFWGFALTILFAMPVMSQSFGITWDEWVHAHYGKLTLRYFLTGGKDHACFGEELSGYRLNFYGHLFDTIAAFIYGIVSGSLHTAVFEDLSWINFYETRHAVNSLFGFLAMLCTGLLAKELGGWRAGLLAIVFIFLSPRFLGHSMNNPKDIPFAAAYIYSIYHMIRFIKQLPEINWKTAFGLMVGIAMAINIRIGGLLLIVYLISFLGIHAFVKTIQKEKSCHWPNIFGVAAIVSIGGYFGGLILWPYGHIAPFTNPFLALKEMSNYGLMINVLFEGKLIVCASVPWYYIPKWILITTPFFIISGWFAAVFSSTKKYFNWVLVSMVLLTALFPVVYVILKKSALYDEWRHLLFVFPPLAVIAALGWEFCFRTISNQRQKIILSACLVFLLAEPASWMIKNHPHEYVYFNQIVGGLDGAFGNYETDYWGNSTRLASEWLRDYIKKEGITKRFVVSSDGSVMQSAYYLKTQFPKQYQPLLLSVQGPRGWDYGLVLSRNWSKKDLLSKAWPPEGTIHTVMADHTILCAVVKNPKRL